MRRIFYVLVVSAVALALAWFIAGLPGRITGQFGDTSFEAATPVVVLAVILLLVLLAIAGRIVALLLNIPSSVGLWGRARRRRQGDAAVTRALVALAAGEKGDARREAARARRLLGETPQTLLLVAESGRLAGREDEAEGAFRQLTERKDAAFLGYRGLMRQALAREDWAEANQLASRAEQVEPGAAWLRHQRMELAVRGGRWAEALDLADVDAPRAALSLGAAQLETDSGRALRLARQAWKDDASLAPAAVTYAGLLRREGRESRAQDVLRHSWSVAPHPDLAAAALSELTDPLARAQAAQRLTHANPDHAESRLLLARTSLDAGLPGEARRHVDALRETGFNQRRIWLLLADIEEAERGGTDEGRAAQREALKRAAEAEPDPGWRCTHCRAPSPGWRPACPACHTAGSLRWLSAGTPGSYPIALVAE